MCTKVLRNGKERGGEDGGEQKILSRILERGLGKARERHEEDEGLDGIKGLKMARFM